MPQPALRAGGAVLVLTPSVRPDLELLGKPSDINLYSVPDPAPRASFYNPQSIKFLPEDSIPGALRSHVFETDLILLPTESRHALIAGNEPSEHRHRRIPAAIQRRNSRRCFGGGSGFVNVLESYDPGWSAEADGQTVPIFAANGFTLAAPVSTGKHQIRFLYETPGRSIGVTASLIAAALLSGLIWFVGWRRRVRQRSTFDANPPTPPTQIGRMYVGKRNSIETAQKVQYRIVNAPIMRYSGDIIGRR